MKITQQDEVRNKVAQELRQAYKVANNNKKGRNIVLPSTLCVEEVGSSMLKLSIADSATYANMQDDKNSIDAWAFVLHRWLGKDIALSWEPQSGVLECNSHVPSQNELNYRRFVYRMERISRTKGLFTSGKVTVSPDMQAEIDKWSVFNTGNLVTNVAMENRGSKTTMKELKSENDFELYFTAEGEQRLQKLTTNPNSLAEVIRQFPVGLFNGTGKADIKKGKAILPGGKSAIDILLRQGDEIVVVELKKPGKTKVGAISELLFYCYFIRDILDGNFLFPEEGNHVLKGAKHVRGCFLLNDGDCHPLIDEVVLKLVGKEVLGQSSPVGHFSYTVKSDGLSCKVQ